MLGAQTLPYQSNKQKALLSNFANNPMSLFSEQKGPAGAGGCCGGAFSYAPPAIALASSSAIMRALGLSSPAFLEEELSPKIAASSTSLRFAMS